MTKTRCSWCLGDPLYVKYHDQEWGCPIHDDPLLFEFLILEGMQAGLSWLTILKKRPSFREAFAGFDPQKVAQFSEKDVERLMKNPGIIRNGLKIRAAIDNATAFLEIQAKHSTFDRYIWQFTDGKTIQNAWASREELPCSSPISDRMAKDLKQNGFKFVGSKICYAFMQAVGMVNDHTTDCFRYKA
jgi:DNA-3-methyladenine glycosylase I